jgi:DNA-directed RNA polymerase specialized sigma24 family protein
MRSTPHGRQRHDVEVEVEMGDISAIWVERMARRFYRCPDDIHDLVSLTIDRIDPEMASRCPASEYRNSTLAIMRGIVIDRYRVATGTR